MLISRVRMGPKVQREGRGFSRRNWLQTTKREASTLTSVDSVFSLNTHIYLLPCYSKWVSLSKITYEDILGKKRLWEVADRRTRPTNGDTDAVAILPILVAPNQKPKTILVTQYRPPVDSYTIELPAGLIDEGESAEETAVRELKEETGYHGTVLKSSTLMGCDPGMISATMKVVICKVDLAAPENHENNLDQRLEDGEYIQRWIVEIENVSSFIRELQEKYGYLPDARLAHFFIAVDLFLHDFEKLGFGKL